MSDSVTIKFCNWEQYNKRAKEYKNPVWFSFQNDFATNRNFYDFTDQQRLIFIYLLCEASQQNKAGSLTIEVEHFCYHTRQKPKDVHATIQKLMQKQILEARDRDGIVTGSCRDRDLAVTEQNRTEQDRTEQDRTLYGAIEKNSISHPEAYGAVVHVFESREVTPEITATWVDAFPDPSWVVAEVHKALAWEGANSTRKKKNFGRFMTNWLTRGWDRRITTAPTKNYAERRYEANKNALEIALAREAAKNEK